MNVISLRPKCIVTTYPIHFYPVEGRDQIELRNPECGVLLSIASPIGARVGIRHVAVDGALSGEEIVEMLMTLPPGGSIAWRKL